MTLMGVSYHNNEARGWDASGLINGFAGGEIPVDTGELVAGFYDFTIIIGGNLGPDPLFFELQHRNAANDANLQSQNIGSLSGTTFALYLSGVEIADDERLRIYCNAACGYICGFSLLWVKRA